MSAVTPIFTTVLAAAPIGDGGGAEHDVAGRSQSGTTAWDDGLGDALAQ